MPVCQHPECSNKAVYGLCEGHRKLLERRDHCGLICFKCSNLIGVFIRPEHISPQKKYFFCRSCRSCGGKKEDEQTVMKDL